MGIVHTLAELIAGLHSANDAPMFVAVCGWADTGKSTLAARLCEALAALGLGADGLSTDAFLKSRAERNGLGISGYNPLALDAQALAAAIGQLAARSAYVYHPYDNRTGARVATPRTLSPQSVVVIEGIHAFHAALRERCRVRVFIHSDEATLRTLRARANVKKRGMDEAQAHQRIDAELAEYRAHVLPGRQWANIRVGVSPDFEYEIEESLLTTG